MIHDKRGDIGFPEAMVGTATVCIVLTMFLAYAVTMTSADPVEDTDVGWERFRGVEITGGTYRADGLASDILSDLSCSGVELVFGPQGVHGVAGKITDCGRCAGDKEVHRRLISVESDDGRTVPTLVEVLVFR